MKSPTSSQRVAVFWGFLDLSRLWESLDRIYEEGLDVGWSNRIGHDGEVLVTPKDRLDNYFRDLVWVPKLGFCPLTGLNPGLLQLSHWTQHPEETSSPTRIVGQSTV